MAFPKIYARHRCVAIGFQFSDTTIMFPFVSLPYGFENALHEVWESPIKRQHHNRKTISLPNLDGYQSNWHIQTNELTMRLYKRRSCTDSFARPVISLEHRPSYWTRYRRDATCPLCCLPINGCVPLCQKSNVNLIILLGRHQWSVSVGVRFRPSCQLYALVTLKICFVILYRLCKPS